MTDQTMHLYGLPVELAEPPEGVIVTDVVVLARGVRLDDQSSDTLLVASTDSTAGIVYRGMLAAAGDLTQEHLNGDNA